MRRGLVEWGVVTAIIALAAAGASALFADRIREAFGVHRPPAARAERAK